MYDDGEVYFVADFDGSMYYGCLYYRDTGDIAFSTTRRYPTATAAALAIALATY